MLKTFEPFNLCPDCEIIRTSRSRHCSICNRCVERFDHHCPWINNCVGYKNHNYFLCFLISVCSLLVTVLITVSIIIHTEVNDGEGTYVNSECPLLILPIDFYKSQFFIAACIAVIVTLCMFMLPVGLLGFV